MSDFIGVISSLDFWVAMFCGFLISIFFAYIIQSVYDMWKDITTTEYYETTGEELYIGCTVYDTVSGITGLFCGTHLEDDILYGVVVYSEDNTIYPHFILLENLKTIKEQE